MKKQLLEYQIGQTKYAEHDDDEIKLGWFRIYDVVRWILSDELTKFKINHVRYWRNISSLFQRKSFHAWMVEFSTTDSVIKNHNWFILTFPKNFILAVIFLNKANLSTYKINRSVLTNGQFKSEWPFCLFGHLPNWIFVLDFCIHIGFNRCIS